MNPTDKAKELVEKFMEYAYVPWYCGSDELTQEEAAKQCALLAVEEIVNECDKYFEAISKDRKTYWEEVKEKIKQL
jgi:hypothetical protein